MGKVIVVGFVTLDGVVEDPDGTGGTPGGGWAFHAGHHVFAGDKFATGPSLKDGVLLLGRNTWSMFAGRWPGRTGAFPDAMNRAAKVVVSHAPPALDAWNNSSALDGDLVEAVARLAVDRDVIVVGSTSVVHQLTAADAVDEYRLITIPVALGAGTPLFATPTSLQVVSVVAMAELDATLAIYERSESSTPPV